MMVDANPEAVANELYDQYGDSIDKSKADIVSEFEELIDDYQVPVDDAKEALQNKYRKQTGQLQQDDMDSTDEGQLADLDTDDQWLTVEVTFVEELDTMHENMVLRGLLGDKSGIKEFTMWDPDTFDGSEMTVGESYRIDSVVGDEFNGQVSAKIVNSSEIESLDKTVDVTHRRASEEQISGTLSHIGADRSGLIKRCSRNDCSRVITNDQCQEHGRIETPEHDIRIAGRVDTGETTHSVIFDDELTESLTSFDHDDAMEYARDNISTDNAVAQKFHDKLVGRDMTLSGIMYEGYFLVNTVSERSPPDAQAITDRVATL